MINYTADSRKVELQLFQDDNCEFFGKPFGSSCVKISKSKKNSIEKDLKNKILEKFQRIQN